MTGPGHEGAPDTGRARRHWRAGDRAKVSIMNVFRACDGRLAASGPADGAREITARSLQRRDGAGEEALSQHLQADLHMLHNTTRLAAAESLDDAPHVARSVLNYGFRDLSDLSATEVGAPDVERSIRRSLLDHEPRIIPATLEAAIRAAAGTGADQRIELSVSAELMSDPVDIALDFDAEVDLGAGKLRLGRFRVQS